MRRGSLWRSLQASGLMVAALHCCVILRTRALVFCCAIFMSAISDDDVSVIEAESSSARTRSDGSSSAKSERNSSYETTPLPSASNRSKIAST